MGRRQHEHSARERLLCHNAAPAPAPRVRGSHENEPLDVTLWNAQWDTTLVHARVGGEFDQITFQHEEPFILVGLNADGRLNQGRLDHTFAVTEPTA